MDVYKDYFPKGIAFIAISSNNIESHPQDGPEHMNKLAKEKKWIFPYCYDETQEVAKSYKAACTPDFFLFDKDLKLYYRGQFDNSRPRNNQTITGKDLRNALDSLIDGKDAPLDQTPSIGCNIKWKLGNEPEYFG
jgi:hypothetical protein